MNDYGSPHGRGDRPHGNRGGAPRYGRGPGSGSGSGGRGFGGRPSDSRNGGRNERGGGYRRDGGRGRPAPRKTCPPELVEPFKEARDFLAGLIAALGLPARLSYGGVEPARDGQQVMIDIRGIAPAGPPDRFRRDDDSSDDDLAILIGKHGAMLDALTAIVNAVMHRGESEGLFFAVDVEGYRSRRVATLRSIAQRSADRALREGVAIELSPMPPSERRIIHLTLAAHPALATESTGSGSNRRVVIVPRDAPPERPPEYDEEPAY
ncbi:MAG TPA: R3H domain-containing nucleic acid-binding protein [Candidatus Eremiobacteraceae bacterium]|nr:R3H domain-containing nucleic acid-binding protein [Candidatus Eremiobacteraceae bacterium]